MNTLHVLSLLSLADRIVRGKYDVIDGDIKKEKNFPMSISSDYDVEYELYHFDHYISLDDAIDEMGKKGFRPATLAELLALGETQPELQRRFPISALGSIWNNGIVGNYAPVLDRDADGKRELKLNWVDYGGVGGYHLLAIRIVSNLVGN